MEEWIAEAGIRYSDALRISSDESGEFSVYAKRNINSNEFIAHIPKSALLSLNNVPAVEELLQSYELHHDEDLALSTAITYEFIIGQRSRWHGYLASIPSKSIETPYVLSEKTAQELLKGLSVLQSIREENERLQLAWNLAVCPLLKKCLPSVLHRKLQFSLFLRAYRIQSSRAFYIDELHGNSLVPFADLLNHKLSILSSEFCIEGSTDNTDSKYEDEIEVSSSQSAEVLLANLGGADSQVAVLTSLKEIPAGKEVLNTYGEHDNVTLFTEYGFVLHDNIFNKFDLDLCALYNRNSVLSKRNCRRRYRSLVSSAGTDEDLHDILAICKGDPVTLCIRDAWLWPVDSIQWAILFSCDDLVFESLVKGNTITEKLIPFVETIVKPGKHNVKLLNIQKSVCKDAISLLISLVEKRMKSAKSEYAEFLGKPKVERFTEAVRTIRQDEQAILRKAKANLSKRLTMIKH